jgi:type 2 lantibiotic biosynthesis protein LanM
MSVAERRTKLDTVNVPITGPDAQLSPLWWAPGLAPQERAADGTPPGRPAWAAFVEDALAGMTGRAAAGDTPAFAEVGIPLRPLVDDAWQQVARGAGTAPGCDLAGLRGAFADWLGGRLANLVARTFVTELKAARPVLAGPTSRRRFVEFVEWLSERGNLAALFAKYPVLARMLGQACVHAVDAQVELLRRFEADRADIVGGLLGGVDPGLLVTVEPGAGDQHERGRSVAVLRFANGARIMYKPRSQDVQVLFGELVRWLSAKLEDGPDLRAVAVVARPSYGWLEFIEARACTDVDQVDRFYRGQGATLALLYAVDATDMHYENLIACGEAPVLVDVETLFHPRLPPTMLADPDPAIAALDASVYRTALLPQFQIGDHGALDLSGLGGDAGRVFPLDRVSWTGVGTDQMRLVRVPVAFEGAANRPRLHDAEIEPAEYLASLLSGFRSGYDAMLVNRDELLGEQGILRRFAGATTRLVSRPTQVYATLLTESTHPDLLRDGQARDQLFDLLRHDTADGSVAHALVDDEIADLWAGDVPMFAGRPGSRDIRTSTGRTVPELLAEAPLDAVRRKVSGLGEMDRRYQEWLITAAIGARTQPPVVEHQSGSVIADPPVAGTPDPERLLVEACGIADDILAMAAHDARRANWVGMELGDGRHWAVQPMDAGLGNGYTGVAVFLAQLGKLTGVARYTELARKAVRPLPGLLDAMTADPEIARAVGPGAFLGLGGIAYALSRITSLDEDASLTSCLLRTVDLLAGCVDDEQAGLTLGRAGGLATMLSVCEESGLPAAGNLAEAFADRLVERPAPVPAAAGFADGSAGVAFALARFDPGAGPYLATARAIMPHELDTTNHAWCSGTSGMLMAHTALARRAPGYREPHDRLVITLGRRPPIRDMSLCHGELGVLDSLAILAAGGHRESAELLPICTARVLAILGKYGPRCGTPNGVSSPGLLTGLAGIGYGLLRLGFPASVPSILALDPQPTQKGAEL